MDRFFLLYEAALALGAASVVALVLATDLGALAEASTPALPHRGAAAYLGALVGLNGAAWLGRIVPAVAHDRVGALLDGTGLSVVPTYAQDLAFWLPLVGVAAWWLWQRRPVGILLGGAALAFWAVEGLTVAVDQWFGHRADPASTVASGGVVLPFAALSVLGAGVLWAFLRQVRPAQALTAVAGSTRTSSGPSTRVQLANSSSTPSGSKK
jgi:hypothetical protein